MIGDTSDAVPDEFPPLDGDAYELRLTRRALDDLGCPADTAPGDLEEIANQTEQSSIVTKFSALRRSAPTGTDAPMRNVGRPGIYSLHGFVGDRACTWYDAAAEVCWLLGWVAQHDYAEFEKRAANGELLPDEDDYTVLEVEREEMDFARRVGPGVLAMTAASLGTPGRTLRRTVGDLLQLEISVIAVAVDADQLADIILTVKVPPLDDPPPGWPGRELPVRLAELATGDPADSLELDFPLEVPDGADGLREIDFAGELAIAIRNRTVGTDPSAEGSE